MGWSFKDGGNWSGGTHELSGMTYSGATRTPESRPLVWIDKPKASPSQPKAPRKKQTPRPKGATAWD